MCLCTLYYLFFSGPIREKNNLPPCYSYPRQLLWNKTEPTGFFYNNRWRLLHCQQPNTSVYRPCLQDKHLMISGDSTTRQWYSFFLKTMQCKQISEKWTTEKWHIKSKCIIPSLNFTLHWLPHALPLFPGQKMDQDKFALNSIAKNINEIGNVQNVIFVIHLHMHLTAFHHSIFHDRIRHISNSVRNILQKNKHVIFMIKGPHTYKIPDSRCNRLNDYFGYVYKDIMSKEFEGLHDKIVFMDQADMSTAKGLARNHPPEDVVQEAVFQMFDYICQWILYLIFNILVDRCDVPFTGSSYYYDI